MTTFKANKRQMCIGCGYPKSTCLCAWITPISSPLNIIILQHPKEAKHAKNTVKLLTLGLTKLTVLQGETSNDWARLALDVRQNPQNYCLFYPHDLSQPMESITALEQKQMHFPLNKTMIFIDASWRKALKIWHLNPWLQLCSSWHFSNPPDNQYQIRHTTQQSSLSTLESVAYVLEFTNSINCQPLHLLFSKMQEKCFLENQK